jgi:alkanesulfonate monooxygenase SsuD/methylene tetrahydromethanopterin reductase-like flavin-dependent oxidoreductase (luciferase family)
MLTRARTRIQQSTAVISTAINGTGSSGLSRAYRRASAPRLTANATIPANATAPVRHQRVTTSPDPRSILASTTDEAIEVLQALWREPVASYHGRFYRFDAASMEPRPPEGAPPIWVAGNAPGGIRRAAQYSSGWLPYRMDLAAFRAGVATLRDLTHGRGCPTIANMFYLRIEKPDEPAIVQSTSPWVEGWFAGNADAMAEHLERYRQAGLEYALCAFQSEGLDDLLLQLRLFANRVAPQFTDAG